MFSILKSRVIQGYRTGTYPSKPPTLPDRFRGFPEIHSSQCKGPCSACADACPVHAIQRVNNQTRIDLGKCIFCGTCEQVCTPGAIHFTRQHSLSSRSRNKLYASENNEEFEQTTKLSKELMKLFGRSIRLRQVSAGGCNACEADTNVLNTLVFDLSRFGIQFVASPRHADGLLVTGPVSKNMELALKKTYDATPTPKIVIAVGACAISGGMFANHEEVNQGVDSLIPVDLYVPGCPPHPYTILDGLLRLLGKV